MIRVHKFHRWNKVSNYKQSWINAKCSLHYASDLTLCRRLYSNCQRLKNIASYKLGEIVWPPTMSPGEGTKKRIRQRFLTAMLAHKLLLQVFCQAVIACSICFSNNICIGVVVTSDVSTQYRIVPLHRKSNPCFHLFSVSPCDTEELWKCCAVPWPYTACIPCMVYHVCMAAPTSQCFVLATLFRFASSLLEP